MDWDPLQCNAVLYIQQFICFLYKDSGDPTFPPVADEFGNDEMVTFAEMFNEVKLYAAAFRKHGLGIGDRVACYMSNRKEAVFAMLATASIGAVWSGPLPYYGARAASNIVNTMEPKFLIAVDHFQDNGNQYHPIDNLPAIVDSEYSSE
ncbi:acetoacetyl-CoA synthetase [Trichonephila clavipes]|nr:acetoacetyl-CoA synthetase [Trichonephila clavipes]